MESNNSKTYTMGDVTNSTAIQGEDINCISVVTDEKLTSNDILKKLRNVIDKDNSISPDDKEKAINQIKILEEMGDNPSNAEIDSKNRAIEILDGTISGLSKTAVVVETFNKLLKMLGL